MSTPHIEARRGDIAETVLLPGDPLRARFIAETFLGDIRQFNTRRNMLGYTGTYESQRVSIMGGGMGIPSTLIYATELIREYGVRRVIRVGTCGGIGDVLLGQIVLAQSASTDSNVNRIAFGGHDFSACADFDLLHRAGELARQLKMSARIAPIFSTDSFYDGDPGILDLVRSHRIVAIEMEAAGLYALAQREGVEALAILTVSDHFDHHTRLSGDDRERSLAQMSELALACARAAQVGG
jgi:purine-nucleoside phosphorylase